MFNLSPRSVVADDRHDRQILAYHTLKFHAVEAEGPIPVQNQDFLPRPGNLCRHGETGSCAKATHWTRIKPVAWLVDVNYAPSIAHDIAAITNHRRVLVNKVSYLAAETHRVNRHSIRVHQCRISFQRPALLGADVLEPVAFVMLFRGLRHLVHTRPHVSNKANRGPAIDTHIFTCQIKPDHVGLRWNERRLTVIEAEVHTRAHCQDGIRPFEGFAARSCEEKRVGWGQAATTCTVEEDGRLDALCEFAQRPGCITP